MGFCNRVLAGGGIIYAFGLVLMAWAPTQLWLDRQRASQFAQQSELLQRVQAPGLSDWLVRNPRFWDAEHAAASRYGATVVPLGFPVHAFRRPADEFHDALAAAGDPDFDGLSRSMRPGLPKIPLPLSGILNGGYEYEFRSYAKVGERIMCRSSYLDIYQKQGKAGPMVLVVIKDEYATADGRPLLTSLNTMIMR